MERAKYDLNCLLIFWWWRQGACETSAAADETAHGSGYEGVSRVRP